MASVNKAIILGNLGDDPDIRSANGTMVANLSIATSQKRKDAKTGESITETEWHRVVLFGRTAEVAKEYLHKGNPVYIEGRLRTRKWQDKNGVDRYTTEVVGEVLQLLGGRESSPTNKNHQPSAAPRSDSFDEDTPF